MGHTMKDHFPASHERRMSRTIANPDRQRGRHKPLAFACKRIPQPLHLELRRLYALAFATELAAGGDWQSRLRDGPVSADALALVDAHMPAMLRLRNVPLLKLAHALHVAVRFSIVDAMRACGEFGLTKVDVQIMSASVSGAVLARLLERMGKLPGRAITGTRLIHQFTRGQREVKFRDVYLHTDARLARALDTVAIPDASLARDLNLGQRKKREIGYWAGEPRNRRRPKVQAIATAIQTGRIRGGARLADVLARTGLTEEVREILWEAAPS